eukprot:10886364-Prorocentrum_lima.AAC.1
MDVFVCSAPGVGNMCHWADFNDLRQHLKVWNSEVSDTQGCIQLTCPQPAKIETDPLARDCPRS